MELNLKEKYGISTESKLTAAFIDGKKVREQQFTVEQTQLILAVGNEFDMGIPEVLYAFTKTKTEEPLADMFENDSDEDKQQYLKTVQAARQTITARILEVLAESMSNDAPICPNSVMEVVGEAIADSTLTDLEQESVTNAVLDFASSLVGIINGSVGYK